MLKNRCNPRKQWDAVLLLALYLPYTCLVLALYLPSGHIVLLKDAWNPKTP